MPCYDRYGATEVTTPDRFNWHLIYADGSGWVNPSAIADLSAVLGRTHTGYQNCDYFAKHPRPQFACS